MKCLQCGKYAVETEVYNGTPIRVCEDGHRTALVLGPEELERPIENEMRLKAS